MRWPSCLPKGDQRNVLVGFGSASLRQFDRAGLVSSNSQDNSLDHMDASGIFTDVEDARFSRGILKAVDIWRAA